MTQPVRTALEIGDRSFFAVMPAFHAERWILGAKLVSVAPANAAKGLHTHLAAISLFNAQTGELLAVMDGRYITETRTAAASRPVSPHAPGPAVTMCSCSRRASSRSPSAPIVVASLPSAFSVSPCASP